MNQADSERLESALVQMGLVSARVARDADVIVLNSCVVRESAEEKVVGYLTSLKPLKEHDPNRVIALMGCMVGPKTSALENRYPYVDVFMQPQHYDPLIELLGDRLGIDPEGCIGPLIARADVSTYIPIIHGCDKFCSFCIIPYRRGREVSRPVSEIVQEAEMLVQRGVKEVTLLGQNVDSYGRDLLEGHDLSDLLVEVNNVDGLERVRFLTSHPNDMSDRIIDVVSELNKVCEHFNLPFQAGGDDVLTRMRRGYTNEQYRALVQKIRTRVPNASISTDVIVGFCGETDEQFQKTYDLMQEIRFDKAHLAAYSTREGTIADRNLKDDVPHEKKKARLKALEELQAGIQRDINERLEGGTVEVLVEDTKNGRAFGRSRNDKLVYIDDAADRIGELIDVKIDESSPWSLRGALKIPA